MEQKKKFRGPIIIAGTAVYMILIMAVLALFGPVYSELPAYLNTDLVQLALGVSICAIVGAVAGVFADKFLNKLMPRIGMVCGGVLAVAYGMMFKFFPGITGFFVAMGIGGVCCGMFTHGLSNDLVMRWYIKKRSDMIAIILAISMFGTALGQTIMTMLYTNGVSLENCFLYPTLIIGAICVVIAVFVVRNNPEDIGQLAYGAEDAEFMKKYNSELNAEKSDVKSASKDKLIVVLKNPVFWLLGFAIIFTNSGAAYICGYLTTFLSSVDAGLFNIGATFMSIMGYTSAAAMLLSGRIINKFGAKKYSILCVASCFIGNGILLWTSFDQSNIVLKLIICTIGYTFGYACCNLHNVLSPILFKDREMATIANTKYLVIVYGFSAIWGPVLSAIITSSGFKGFYILCLVFNVFVLVGVLGAFIFAKKRGQSM